MVVNAARRSYGKGYDTWSDVPRTARGRSDTELIVDLAGDGHLLPFRHPHVTLSCDAPLPVARQLGKHQVGLEWSEISRRYKKDGIEFYRIGKRWRKHSDVRQGTGELLPDHVQIVLANLEYEVINKCVSAYEMALDGGATPEQARFLLPQSMEVSWTWTGSLLAFWHLYKMRHKPDTQKETRDFVAQAEEIVWKLFPRSWEALKLSI